MKKNITKTFLFIVLMFISKSIYAQWGIVIDRATTAQAVKNTAAIVGTESLTERYLNQSKEYQTQIEKNVLAVQAALELYRKSYENVSQFGIDNRNVKI